MKSEESRAKLDHEIAERRQAEAALREATENLERANERLKEIEHLKSEFLSTMSHELRTPLNSIIGFTGILRQELAGPLNEEQKKQLGMVQGSARHLLTLINNLLDLSRVESGRMAVRWEVFDPADVVAEVVESVEPLARQKNLTIETHIENPHPQMKCDRRKCAQILLNLADNAVKFTEKGCIRIETRCESHEVTFSVSDTGIGIQPAAMPFLFAAFWQGGTGLGLHLSSRLAGLLQGSIRAESDFGVGSRFFFSAPINPASPHP